MLILGGVAAILFVVSVIILVRLVPGPHSETDYLIIGCLATLISLVALFVVVVTTWVKPTHPFYKERKK
ncbi:MAG: hypothetical protein L0271_27905 [Gemmatimonadetes bacterium]|nr:hypothetical protein [Gemmatimonadota bacterium]